MEILLPVLTLSILGLLFGIGLAYANKIFFVAIDPKTEKILAVLPGSNCGACGFAGCQALAEAIVKGQAAPETCLPGGYAVHQKVAAALGVAVKHRVKFIATLICAGGCRAPDRHDCEGLKDCVAANMYQMGHKSCLFGCTGFASCIRVCPFDAIKMDDNDLPVIDKKLCTGCAKCVKICPKKILELKPAKSHIWVACNSTGSGPVVMKLCGYGCIACGKCVKACKFDAIRIMDNLAKIDYNKCTNCRQCIAVCPTKVIKTDYV